MKAIATRGLEARICAAVVLVPVLAIVAGLTILSLDGRVAARLRLAGR
jgi:hypothetical protein